MEFDEFKVINFKRDKRSSGKELSRKNRVRAPATRKIDHNCVKLEFKHFLALRLVRGVGVVYVELSMTMQIPC